MMNRKQFLVKSLAAGTFALGSSMINFDNSSSKDDEVNCDDRNFRIDHRQSDLGKFRAGFASIVINNEVGRFIQGGGFINKAEYIRDNLEANAFYLSNEYEKIIMISCDLARLGIDIIEDLQKLISKRFNFPLNNVLISTTHTHSGPVLRMSNPSKPIDHEYVDKLKGWLIELSDKAINSAVSAKIGWGKGEAQIGFSRRLTWSNRTHSHGGDPYSSEFCGYEGPVDPQHLAIFVSDLEERVIGIIYHNTTHPTTFYGKNVYSADFPGEVRAKLRRKLGDHLSVLFLNGAQGDIAMHRMTDPWGKWTFEQREKRMESVADLLYNKTMEIYHDISYTEFIILSHSFEDLRVGIRLPSLKDVEESRILLENSRNGVAGINNILAYGKVRLYDEFKDIQFELLQIHAIRINDLAIITQPCELYCQFGLDIKARSPAKDTIVVGLTNGSPGYCPTIHGILGGGYSADPIAWTRLEPYAGYKIVDSAAILLNKLFKHNV